MNKYDIVIPKEGHQIHCATSIYPAAVIAQVEPLILCSHTGDMLWSNENIEDFDILDPDIETISDDIRKAVDYRMAKSAVEL